MPPDPELSCRSTVPESSHSRRSSGRRNGRRSSRASSTALPQSDSRRELSRDTTWQTVSRFSEPLLQLPSPDLEFQQWCTQILEYADREDLEIAPLSENTPDVQNRDTSCLTETTSSLPYLDSLGWRQDQAPIQSPSLAVRGIKQQRRNATVFALLEASLANLRASFAEYTHETSTPSSPSRGNLQIQSNETSTSGTSGGYRESPEGSGSGRTAPNKHTETLEILEGNGPFVLDARDISRSQFQGRPGDYEDTTTFGSFIQLQSVLCRDRIDGNTAGEQVHPWTSGVFNQLEDEIVSSLRDMEGAAAARTSKEQPLSKEIEGNVHSLLENMGTISRSSRGQEQENRAPPGDTRPEPDEESVNSGDHASPVASPLPSLPIVALTNTGSRKERFGKLGRWWKRIVTR